jgi:hypothetical protein
MINSKKSQNGNQPKMSEEVLGELQEFQCSRVGKLRSRISPALDPEYLAEIVKALTDPGVLTYSNRPRRILDNFGDAGEGGRSFIDDYIPTMTVIPGIKTTEQVRRESYRNLFAYGFWCGELYYNRELLKNVRRLVGVPW